MMKQCIGNSILSFCQILLFLLSQNIMYFILKSLHDDRVQHYMSIYIFLKYFKFDIFTSKMEKNTASVEPELHLKFSVKSVLYAKVSS
jgi:hypothetical protein